MTGKKGSTHYTAEVKEQAVRMFLEEGMTYQVIADRLEIRDSKRIKRWVHDYRSEGALGLHKAKGRPKKVEDQAAYIARLEMENALLKKFHAELRKLTKNKAGTE
jgi:transposase-like protein